MQYLDKKEVGIRIKELRRKKNMTQQQLADILCYSTQRQLQRIENGEIACSVDRLIEISQIFETSTDYILFGEKICTDREIKAELLLNNKEKECFRIKIIMDNEKDEKN